MRGGLAVAACLATLAAGVAGAAAPPQRYATISDARVDPKGTEPPVLKPDHAATHIERAASPQASTSNQYPAEVEPNDTSATATPLTGAASAREGNIFGNGDVDYWSFTAAAGDRVYVAVMTSLSASASVDSLLDLLDSDGVSVLETDADDGSFGATSSSIAGASLPAAGTYYLRVRHATTLGQLRPYRLFFQLRSGAPVAETEPNDTFPGQALPASNWVSGSTSSTTDNDFYSLGLNAGDTVFVSVDLDPERDTTEWNAQIGLGLFGTPSQILVVNDGGTGTPDSEAFFMTVKDAGTYGVIVGPPAGGSTFGTYHLNVSVFPQADDGVNCTTYTSTDVPVTIPEGPAIVTSALTIPGNPRIEDLDVAINLTHNFMADLDVQLTAPGGNTVGLFSDIGSVTSGVQTTMDTVFDDEAAVPSLFNVTQGMRLTPELNYRLSWFDGQPAGGNWTLTIRDDAAADGGALNGWSLRVCEVPPPPACPPGTEQVTLGATDFESGDGGFTHAGAADEWERGTPSFGPITTCNSGTNCWKTDLDNTYDASSDQTLLSPNIDLTGLQAPILVKWAQKYNLEAAQFDRFSIDLREVATPANAVRLFQHLGATMTETVGNPAVTIEDASGWSETSARADALAGLNVEFAARLTSDTTVQKTGVAIDDFSVSACRALSSDLAITKTDGVTSATPGGLTTYTITASNAGPDPVTGATVADTFPAALTCTWTCAGAGGGTCTAAGSGNLNDSVNLPTGGSTTYTASCAIAANVGGALGNTATVASPITDPNPANNSATDTDTLTPQADFAITKTDGVTSVTAGGSTTYTITSSNAGPSDAIGITVTDTFATSLTCSWTCSGAGGGICMTNGFGNITDSVSLPAGGSVTHSATCAVSGAASGSLSNTAMIATPAGVSDPTPANNSATDTDTILVPASVRGSKTAAGAFTIGSTVTYTVTLNNGGGAQGDNPGDEFTDTLLPQLTLVSASASSGTAIADVGSNAVSWNGAIPNGGSVTITITATINAGPMTSIANQGSISYDGDGDGSNDSSALTDDPATGAANDPTVFVIVPTADLSITKTDGVTTAIAGGSTTYTIVAANAGPFEASGATVADAFPAALTCTWTCVGAGGGTCTASGSGNLSDAVNLPAGGSVSYSATCAISASASGTLSNTATVLAPAGTIETNPADNSATDTDSVIVPSALSGTMMVAGSFLPNGNVSYAVTLANGGGAQTDNPGDEFTDVLPASLTLVSATANSGTAIANLGTNTVSWNGAIAAGASVTITINATIAASASGTISNQGAFAYDADGNGTNESSGLTDDPSTPAPNDPTSFAVGASADLSISKTDGVATVQAGSSSTYTIVATNAGPSAVSGATVSDAFPPECTTPSWTCAASGGGSCPAAGSGDIAANVDLPVGASVTFTASCAVDAGTTVGSVITNSTQVAVPADTDDPDPANNSASDTTTVTAAPLGAAVSGSKSVSGDFVEGGVVIYTIVLSNSGGAQADNAGDEFVDVLPAQLALVSASASSGTAVANVGANAASWNGAIASTGRVTITIQATIVAGASGPVSNQGAIRYDGDADGSNEANAPTDDPAVAGTDDATTFRIAGAAAEPTPVPGSSTLAVLLLALGLVFAGWRRAASPRR